MPKTILNTPTTKDPLLRHTNAALAALAKAKERRETRRSYLTHCFETYGDHGSLIAGCEREHFPNVAKDWLRNNALAIAAEVDAAYACWLAAGRNRSTLHRIARTYMVDGVRY